MMHQSEENAELMGAEAVLASRGSVEPGKRAASPFAYGHPLDDAWVSGANAAWRIMNSMKQIVPAWGGPTLKYRIR
jgi:hypothetical protein